MMISRGGNIKAWAEPLAVGNSSTNEVPKPTQHRVQSNRNVAPELGLGEGWRRILEAIALLIR